MANRITVYKDIKDASNPTYTSIKTISDKIKSGGELKETLIRLKDLHGDEYKKEKASLPVICFGGEFDRRSKTGLKKSSGFLTLDFDNVKDMDELKERLESKPYVILNFKSPSHKGYKTIVRIPKVTSDEEYKVFFKALQKEFPEVDESGKDISRACLFSYDPNIYVNLYAVEYRLPEMGKMLHQVKDWAKVNRALKKIEDSIDGERHIVRMKVSYLFGGWVKSGGLTYADALDLIEASVRKNTSDFPAAMKSVRDGLSAGMSQPLSLNDEGKVLDMKIGLGKVYYHMDDIWDKVKEFYNTGYQRGFDTGWEDVDEYYSVLLGTTTIIYAHPYSGKTQFWNEVLINLSVNYGLNHVLLSPESGEVEHIFGELISIYAGQTMVGKYKMTEQKFLEAADFIKRHFFILDTFGEDFNIRDFFTQVEAIERVFGIKIHTTTIDPLNYLDHISDNLRSDKAQDKDLDVFNADARKNQRHNAIITHVRDLPPVTEKDKETGRVVREWMPVPRPKDVLNGQSFWRKGMNMLCTYRTVDFDDAPLPNCEANQTNLIFSKIKPKGVGKRGMVSIYYDWQKNRYYTVDSMRQRHYAKGFTATSLSEQPQQIESTISPRMTHKWDVTDEAPF